GCAIASATSTTPPSKSFFIEAPTDALDESKILECGRFCCGNSATEQINPNGLRLSNRAPLTPELREMHYRSVPAIAAGARGAGGTTVPAGPLQRRAPQPFTRVRPRGGGTGSALPSNLIVQHVC